MFTKMNSDSGAAEPKVSCLIARAGTEPSDLPGVTQAWDGQDPNRSRGSDVSPITGSVGGGSLGDRCLPLAAHRDALSPIQLGDRDIPVQALRGGSVLTSESGSGGWGAQSSPRRISEDAASPWSWPSCSCP